MDILPREGDWCLFPAGGGGSEPRVCFDTYQEALEFPHADIPHGQGFHARGEPRVIRCQSTTGPKDLGVQFDRRDGFHVSKIQKCVSFLGPER
jgi:hypothetical protein